MALAAHRTYAELLGRRSGLAAVAEAPSTQLDERRGGRARRRRPLVVGHGGGIEPGLVACLPDADHQSWVRRSA